MALRYALLASLYESPATGYELTRRFRERMGNVWNASHQQIYRELAKALDDGLVKVELVEQSGKPDRKVYHLADSGRAELGEWVNGFSPRPATRDPLLLKLFAGDLWSHDRLFEELSRYELDWQEELERYREIEQDYFQDVQTLPRHYKLQYLALRRGIMATESWLAWAREVRDVCGASPEGS
ncbi:PadR family transcriptional regulator [Marinobacter adhaerens]|jgi:PadR family transcriptional regulator, regulatory protein AphA|uniref:PadR family transcriptional regulator n=1 Tax=Marinobacter adhaerens TaxID=1033846 RepID=UPI001E640E5E|nr:PadR family transcriptional regulator [Marinobacter adhaerens]MCD1647747.1 PadR family transcriptional regulator [Marinobacter adhaerens]